MRKIPRTSWNLHSRGRGVNNMFQGGPVGLLVPTFILSGSSERPCDNRALVLLVIPTPRLLSSGRLVVLCAVRRSSGGRLLPLNFYALYARTFCFPRCNMAVFARFPREVVGSPFLFSLATGARHVFVPEGGIQFCYRRLVVLLLSRRTGGYPHQTPTSSAPCALPELRGILTELAVYRAYDPRDAHQRPGVPRLGEVVPRLYLSRELGVYLAPVLWRGGDSMPTHILLRSCQPLWGVHPWGFLHPPLCSRYLFPDFRTYSLPVAVVLRPFGYLANQTIPAIRVVKAYATPRCVLLSTKNPPKRVLCRNSLILLRRTAGAEDREVLRHAEAVALAALEARISGLEVHVH